MFPFLSLVKFKLAATQNNVSLVIDVVGNYVQKPHLLRFAVGNCHHVDAVTDLQLRVFEQSGNHFFNVAVFAQFNYGTHSLFVAFVHNFRYALEQIFFLVLQSADFYQHIRFVYAVGNFRDYNVFSVADGNLYVHFGTQNNFSLACFVCLFQSLSGNHVPSRGKIRSLDDFHHIGKADVFVFNEGYCAFDNFAEIVRRNVRGKPHGNARCAVNQQIGEASRQHVRFFGCVVKVA